MQATRFFLLLLCAPLWLAANSDPADPSDPVPAGLKPIRTLQGVEEYELTSNGLRVLLLPNEQLPVATVMVTYQVGSRNESIGTTGATHILEHMMFKGTPSFNEAKGNDYSSIMERIGARSNATTWFDRTNYFATVPSEYVPLTIEMEADRMRHLLIQEEDLASEMTVVRNEYERGENNPVRTLIKEIFAAAFMAHPYGHPTIGWRSDIERTNPAKLRRFYDTYYWPENAVLTIIGGFDPAATLAAVAEHYGAIDPAPEPIPEVTTEEPNQLGPRRIEISRAGQTGVVMAGYKVPEATHEDWPALLLIDQIVGADKTGRLYRALEDKGKASATFTFAPELRDPGLFIFGAYLTPEATHEEVEAILFDEIERLIGGGVTEAELARAKSVIQAAMIYGRDGPFAIARQINDAIAMGDWTLYLNRPKAIDAVTAETVRDVAARYFKPSARTVGWFVPEVKNRLSPAPSAGPLYFRDPSMDGMPAGPQMKTSEAPGNTSAAVHFSKSMQSAEVAGIEVVAIDLPVEGVVSFVGSFAAGDILSPKEQPMLASLTAAMLDKGTVSRDRFAIAEQLDAMGASIRFGAGAHSLGFSGKFLRADAGPVLELLAGQLRNPAFDPDVFKTVKARKEANLLQAIDDTGYRAGAELARLLYPPEHPNYAEKLESLLDSLKGTKRDELVSFHRDHYGPESMRLVFAGDIDFEQLKAAVAIAFEGWSGGTNYPGGPFRQLPNEAGSNRIQITDKPSVSVQYGYNTGLQRTDPDYLPFMVGNYILGGGFQSRLMQEVRKRRGLTYDIRSSHQGDILTPGNWTLTASFSPGMLKQGLAASRSVFENWHEEGVSESEVQAAVETLTGSYLVGLSTTARVAAQVHSFLQRGYPADYIDRYPNKLRAIDADAVNRTIREYFDPAALRLVIAGSLDAAAGGPAPAGSSKVSLRLDAPDPAWQLEIEAIYRQKDELIAVSRLAREPDAGATQVITALTDHVTLPGKIDLPVKHYVIGKTWEWGDSNGITFVDSEADLAGKLEGAQPIYSK